MVESMSVSESTSQPRWLNQSALGEWRTAFETSVPLHYFLWFFLRMPVQEESGEHHFNIPRCQRRLIHQCAQKIDDSLNNDVYLSHKIRLENAAVESNPRLRASQVKQELLRRFLARNAGFCGTQNSANQDLIDAGLIESTGKSNKGTIAAAHFVAVYWSQAACRIKTLMKDIAHQGDTLEYPSFAIFHDASDLCGKEVPRLKKTLFCVV